MASKSQTRQLVVFSVGTEEYALGIEHVHEVIRYVQPRAISSSDAAVLGVISLRSRILPLLDLSARLGVPSDGVSEDARIVVINNGGEMSGLLVDAVTEVLTVDIAAFTEAPVPGGECVAGIVRIEDRLLVVLEPAATAGAPAAADDGARAVA